MAKKPNMRIWEQVERTDPGVTKPTDLGRMKITAISPQSQRKRATELWGPIGQGWGVDSEDWRFLDVGDTKLCMYTAQLWYMDDKERREFPINAVIKVSYKARAGYEVIDDEFSKKVSTNALTKGLSMLGFNSDVFEGKFDDCRYVNALKEEFATDDKRTVPATDKPPKFDKFKQIMETTAKSGGSDAVRSLWMTWARESPTKEEVAACKTYIKNTPSEQEWQQKTLKDLAAQADKTLAGA